MKRILFTMISVYVFFKVEAQTTTWNLSGNAGTTPGTHFIGTTDDKDIIFKRNGVFSGIIGSSNTSIGLAALGANTSGNSNSANGFQVLYSNTTGSSNTATGYKSLFSNTTASYNTANGFTSLFSNTTGYFNTANGAQTLYFNTSGIHNTANGANGLYSNTTGSFNTSNGTQTLQNNTTGSLNTGTGSHVLHYNTTGYNNTATGVQTLYSNTIGHNNIADGYYALFSNVTGAYNSAIGVSSGKDVTDGSNNTLIGYNTGLGITTGNYNTILGANVSGLTNDLSNNIIIADGQGNRRINVDENGYVGIGTNTPQNKLEITQGTSGNSGLRFTNLTSSSLATISSGKALSVNANGDVILENVDGSNTKITAGTNVSISGNGTTTTPYIINANYSNNWNTSSLDASSIINSNTGAVIIGPNITSLPTGYKLYVSNGILTEKLKVALKSSGNWADFVLEKGYKLMPIKNVKSFIDKHNCLPGVKPAGTLVKEGGINVTEMLATQMQKIEELTLYLIKLNESIEKLKKENLVLKKAMKKNTKK